MFNQYGNYKKVKLLYLFEFQIIRELIKDVNFHYLNKNLEIKDFNNNDFININLYNGGEYKNCESFLNYLESNKKSKIKTLICNLPKENNNKLFNIINHKDTNDISLYNY